MNRWIFMMTLWIWLHVHVLSVCAIVSALNKLLLQIGVIINVWFSVIIRPNNIRRELHALLVALNHRKARFPILYGHRSSIILYTGVFAGVSSCSSNRASKPSCLLLGLNYTSHGEEYIRIFTVTRYVQLDECSRLLGFTCGVLE